MFRSLLAHLAFDRGQSDTRPPSRSRTIARGPVLHERLEDRLLMSANHAPTAPGTGGPYAIAEGASLVLKLVPSTDRDGDPLTYSWDVNGDGVYGDELKGTGTASGATFTWAQLGLLGINDGPAQRSVRVRVSDGRGGTATSSASTLTVNNTAPTLTLGGAAAATQGAPYVLNLGAVIDPGADTVSQYVVHWGDGATSTYTGTSLPDGRAVTHTYAAGLPSGTLRTIAVDLKDEDGTYASAATRSISVVKPLFNAMQYWGQPDLSRSGVTPIYVIYEWMLTGDGGVTTLAGRDPDEQVVRQAARQYVGADTATRPFLVTIDIESWPTDIRSSTTGGAAEATNLARYARVADLVKQELPNAQVGFYGVMPICDYWTAYNYGMSLSHAGTGDWWDATFPEHQAAYASWQSANDFVRDGLASHVDVVFPSLYQFYDDLPGWEIYAQENIAEARRFGKPVHPFLWNRYHPSDPTLQNALLPATYWREQLDLTTELSDGAVMWGGVGENWDPQAAWWQATQSFLDANGNSQAVV
jgi:hypothetical protein